MTETTDRFAVPTAADVRSLLVYDPETGDFTWKHSRVEMKGKPAGSLDAQGYRRISINDRLYRSHRLAWLYVHGTWPVMEIDHINGVRHDNRLCNLREADRFMNTQNCVPRKRPGRLPGTMFIKKSGLWKAQIRAENSVHVVGMFATEQDAHAAYMAAKERMHVGHVDRLAFQKTPDGFEKWLEARRDLRIADVLPELVATFSALAPSTAAKDATP